MNNIPTVLIKYKSIKGAEFSSWTRVRKINPITSPGYVQVEKLDGEKVILYIRDIDIAYGGMADMLFNEESDGEEEA